MIYISPQLLQFAKRLVSHAKAILKNEMGFEVRSKRFVFQNYLYPIQIVCFEHEKRLGYFDPELHEIGIHRDLMGDESVAIDVLKHELAHYIAFLEFGSTDHGKDFHTICERYHFPKEVSRATHSKPIVPIKSIESKVEKLLRLAKNSSLHESQAALLKAEELMLKHNVKPQTSEELYGMLRVLPSKRSSGKQKAIGQMLKHFNVEVIFHQGKGVVYLELIGQVEHVEIASYVAYFLDQKMDQLYKEASKEHRLKGIRAKNSFMMGIAKGYDEQKRTTIKERALIKANLTRALSMAYPNLSSTYSQSGRDPHSHALGQSKGRNLSIDPGVTKKKRPLLSYFGL